MPQDRGNLVERLSAIAGRPERLVVGLSSGTSYDGIDAALVRVAGFGSGLAADLVRFGCFPFEPTLRAQIAAAPGAATPEIARLNFALGEAFADAALGIIDEAGLSPSDVDLVGSHGQTIWHDPPPRDGSDRTGATLQIGEPDVIARRLGVVTVADFRTADVAAGGSGAPLIPLVDWLLFRGPGEARLLVNIGGIANVTYVVETLEDVVAFDTGPGNALVDEIVRVATGGERSYDEEGAGALRGTVADEAVVRFLSRAYFGEPPPKSTGKELFGTDAARQLTDWAFPGRHIVDLNSREVDDLLATAAAVTARSIAGARAFLPSSPPVGRVIVSGGGVRNRAMMSELERLFVPVPVESLEEHGMDPDAKEAVGFALLANETLGGLPGNLPAVTGASAPVVLGKICPGL
jgi:anhydro-N-acetylmuramic acid kinase